MAYMLYLFFSPEVWITLHINVAEVWTDLIKNASLCPLK